MYMKGRGKEKGKERGASERERQAIAGRGKASERATDSHPFPTGTWSQSAHRYISNSTHRDPSASAHSLASYTRYSVQSDCRRDCVCPGRKKRVKQEEECRAWSDASQTKLLHRDRVSAIEYKGDYSM